MSKAKWPPLRITFGEDQNIRHKYSTDTIKDFQRLANLWFSENIESLGPASEVFWKEAPVTSYQCMHWHGPEKIHTHRAILIGIEPLKEETAEDLLKEMIKDFNSSIIVCNTNGRHLFEKARAYLNKRGVK
jgi:hypothetical protein